MKIVCSTVYISCCGVETNTLIKMEERKKKSHRNRKSLCEKKPERLERSRNGQMKPFGSQDAFCMNECVYARRLWGLLCLIQGGKCQWKPQLHQETQLCFCQAMRQLFSNCLSSTSCSSLCAGQMQCLGPRWPCLENKEEMGSSTYLGSASFLHLRLQC